MSKYRKWVWLFAIMMLMTAVLGQVAHSTGSVGVSDRGPIVAAASSTGGHNTIFVTEEGKVYVNGDNASAQRGDNTTTTPSTDDGKKTFTGVTTNGTTLLTGIDNLHATLGNVFYAWDEDTAKLYTWGNNDGGTCGISSQTGDYVKVATQVNFWGASITFDGEKTQQIAVVGSTVGLIDSAGDVWSWGRMSTADATPANRVVDFRLGRSPGTPNTADNTDTLASDSDSDGIVTDGNAYVSIIPAKISLTFDTGEKAVAIGAGDSKTFYILTNLGKLYAWGGSEMSPSNTFTEIVHPNAGSGYNFIKMSVSHGGAVGLIDNYGEVYVSNVASVSSSNVTPAKPDAIYDGTIGNPTAAAGDFYKIVAAGGPGKAAFIVIEGNRTVYVWGDNSNGIVGMGTLPPSPNSYTTATACSNLGSSEDLSATYLNGIMVKNNTLYTWGDNTKGQLGRGTVGTDSGTPTACVSTYLPSYVNNWASPTATPTVTAKPNPNGYDFMINEGNVLQTFIRIGAEYNQNLYSELTEAAYGITSTNVSTVESYVNDLKLHSTRIFYDPDPAEEKWIDPDNQGLGTKPADPNWASFRSVVELAHNNGVHIGITYWHSAQTDPQMGRMHAFANEIYYLRKTLGYTLVDQITIQNEPNGYGIDIDEWEEGYRAFDEFCKDLGIRDELTIVGGDLVYASEGTWFDRMANYMSGIVDDYSSHIYWDHWYPMKFKNRLNDITTIVSGYSDLYKQKDIHITEFGVKGYDRAGYCDPGASVATGTPVYAMADYIPAAFQRGWFMMWAFNKGNMKNMVQWDAYRAKYDGGKQDHSMIGDYNQGFPKRPHFYMTWLFTHALPEASNFKVVAAERYDSNNTDEICTVFKNQSTGAKVVFLANSDTSQRTITVGGLPASTTYKLYRWNWAGTGLNTDAGTTASDSNGRISVNVNPESIAVVTADTLW